MPTSPTVVGSPKTVLEGDARGVMRRVSVSPPRRIVNVRSTPPLACTTAVRSSQVSIGRASIAVITSPGTQSGVGRRVVRLHGADLGQQHRHADHEDEPEDQDGEEDVGERAGHDDDHPRPDRLVLERQGRVRRRRGGRRRVRAFGGHRLLLVLADHLDETAEREGGEDVLGPAAHEAPDARSETDREFDDADAEPSRGGRSARVRARARAARARESRSGYLSSSSLRGACMARIARRGGFAGRGVRGQDRVDVGRPGAHGTTREHVGDDFRDGGEPECDDRERPARRPRWPH